MPLKPAKEITAGFQNHLKSTAAELLAKPPVPDDLTGKPTIEAVKQQEESGATVAAPPPTPPSSTECAMTIKEFVDGTYLEPGDVILMTRLGSFFSTLLRLVDKSNFAHVAMVFQTPRNSVGLDETFLIETTMGGTDIVPLSQFLAPTEIYSDTGLPHDFVVGVKRLDAPWLQEKERKITAGRMLHFLKEDDYNFRLLAALSTPATRNLYFKMKNSLRGRAPSASEILKMGVRYLPRDFICSGFVQYAYIEMVRSLLIRGDITYEMAEQFLEEVVFVEGLTKDSQIRKLMACTPRDLACTEKLAWKYLIHGGEVFHVNTNHQVEDFFGKTLPKRAKIGRA